MPDAPLFTVFTPTYNRAHTLHRVFDSLQAQTLRDFEWLVVDDGSTDNTPELIADWVKTADFPIRYFRQEHSGKHIAQNRAVREARGYFFIVLDSDDGLLPQTLERMKFRWNTIPANEREAFCGVGGLSVDQYGKIVGDCFSNDPIDANMRERRYVYRVRGEKCIATLTELIRRIPFPEIQGTDFVPEGTVWLELGKTHRIRWTNEIFRIYYMGEEATAGPTLTNGISLKDSAGGRLHYYLWLLNNDLEYFFRSPRPFLKAAVMLPVVTWLSRRSLNSALLSLDNMPAKALVFVALPFAWLLYKFNKARP